MISQGAAAGATDGAWMETPASGLKPQAHSGLKPFRDSLRRGADESAKAKRKRVRSKKRAIEQAAREQAKNGDVYITWPFRASDFDTAPTSDPFDRAHNVHDPRGGLMPSCRKIGKGPRAVLSRPLVQSTPRRYPPELLNNAGVSIDSAAEALDEMQARILEDFGPVDGISKGQQPTMADAVRERLNRVVDPMAVRAIVRPKLNMKGW